MARNPRSSRIFAHAQASASPSPGLSGSNAVDFDMDQILDTLTQGFYYAKALFSGSYKVIGLSGAPMVSALVQKLDPVSILVLLLIFYVSLLILQHTMRMIYRTVVTLIRMVFVVASLGVGVYIYTNGFEQTYRDVYLWLST